MALKPFGTGGAQTMQTTNSIGRSLEGLMSDLENKHTEFFQKLEEKFKKIDLIKTLHYGALNRGQGPQLSEALCITSLLVGISIWWMNNALTPLLLFHFNKLHFFV